MSRTALTLLSGIACTACGISPISNKIDIGEDHFVAFVGEGKDGRTDLFAVETGGGLVYQITFTPVVESQPQVVPDGSLIAFLRMSDTLPGTSRDIVVMSLVTGSEHTLKLPADVGIAQQIAWSDSLDWIYLRTAAGDWRVSANDKHAVPERVADGDGAAADSLLSVWAGRPRFARVVSCKGAGICLVLPTGDTTSVSDVGRDAFSWGADSLAWFEDDQLIVRSLGAGAPRRAPLRNPPARPRSASYAGK